MRAHQLRVPTRAGGGGDTPAGQIPPPPPQNLSSPYAVCAIDMPREQNEPPYRQNDDGSQEDKSQKGGAPVCLAQDHPRRHDNQPSRWHYTAHSREESEQPPPVGAG